MRKIPFAGIEITSQRVRGYMVPLSYRGDRFCWHDNFHGYQVLVHSNSTRLAVFPANKHFGLCLNTTAGGTSSVRFSSHTTYTAITPTCTLTGEIDITVVQQTGQRSDPGREWISRKTLDPTFNLQTSRPPGSKTKLCSRKVSAWWQRVKQLR